MFQIKKDTLLFSNTARRQVNNLLGFPEQPENANQEQGGTSGNLRLDVMLSEDRKFAAVQLFQFVPYTYNPVTSVRYFTNGEAASIAAFLTKTKGH